MLCRGTHQPHLHPADNEQCQQMRNKGQVPTLMSVEDRIRTLGAEGSEVQPRADKEGALKEKTLK